MRCPSLTNNCIKVFLVLLFVFAQNSFLNSQVHVDSTRSSDTLDMQEDILIKAMISDTLFQKDSLAPKLPVPKKSVIYSLILPGAGQVYNRRAWKVPIIYAGLGTGIYFIIDNRKNYREFRDAFITRKAGGKDIYEGVYSDEGLKAIRDIYRKRMEQSYFGTFFVYLLNGIEAYVDAHLQNFDISEDLSLRFRPKWDLYPDGAQVGIALHLQF